jgi:NADPH-dependent ferric siderophore reductase
MPVSLLSAETSVSLPDPLSIVDAFEDHFSEHMEMEREGTTVRFKAEYGHGSFSAEGGRFAARVSCVSEHILMSVKAMVAEHIVEFSGKTGLDFRWSGHGAYQRELPNLFVGKVARAYNLTPHMRRLVVSVDSGIERLVTGGMHVRLLLVPDQARAPVWPYLAPTGAIVWPAGDDLLMRRVYTIRSGDVGRGEVDIDFVMHEGDDMPGANFGATAKPGDVLGIIGPSGTCPEAERYVFAGDETALPVMLRMAAEMPVGKTLSVYAEIDNEAERQEIVCAANVEWTWLYRRGKPAGTAGLIEQALRGHAWSDNHEGLHVFVACEKTEARAAKSFLTDEIAFPKASLRAVGYWSMGLADDH